MSRREVAGDQGPSPMAWPPYLIDDGGAGVFAHVGQRLGEDAGDGLDCRSCPWRVSSGAEGGL